jgi:hypothetical protein
MSSSWIVVVALVVSEWCRLAFGQLDFIVVTSAGSKLAVIDLDTGNHRVIGSGFGVSGTDHWGILWNPTSNEYIVTLSSFSQTNLRYGVVDPCTGVATVRGTPQTHNSLAVDIDSNGQMWGISYTQAGQNLNRLDLTGQHTVVGPTALGSSAPMDLAATLSPMPFLYAINGSGDVQLVRIDTATGRVLDSRSVANSINIMGIYFNSSGHLLGTEYTAAGRLFHLPLAGTGPITAQLVAADTVNNPHSGAAIPRNRAPACWFPRKFCCSCFFNEKKKKKNSHSELSHAKTHTESHSQTDAESDAESHTCGDAESHASADDHAVPDATDHGDDAQGRHTSTNTNGNHGRRHHHRHRNDHEDDWYNDSCWIDHHHHCHHRRRHYFNGQTVDYSVAGRRYDATGRRDDRRRRNRDRAIVIVAVGRLVIDVDVFVAVVHNVKCCRLG